MVEEINDEVEDEAAEENNMDSLEEDEEGTDEETAEDEEVEGEEVEERAEDERKVGRKSISTEFTGYGRDVKSDIVPSPKSKFLVVVCKKCKNEQIVFNKPATVIHCQKCNAELVIPTGGEAIIDARVVRVLG